MAQGMMLKRLLAFTACTGFACAGVTVRKTGKAPTGYEVDFTYVNATTDAVVIGGGLLPFTDQFHTTPQFSAGYDPNDYQPGDFWVNLGNRPADYGPGGVWPGYMMTKGDNGTWTATYPFPSGTYQYAFVPGCSYAPNCTLTVTDPDNPPLEPAPGYQTASTFQVPYDPRFQFYKGPDLNFDYALPAPKEHKGTLKFVNYTSPNSTAPAPNVHDFAIYLPAEYGTIPNKTYPLLYLEHGGEGNSGDWPNMARFHQIMDNLIMNNYTEPTVVVCPTHSNLDGQPPIVIAGSGGVTRPDFPDVRENYMKYLFPYIEANYAVTKDPAKRAFAGLSLGAVLTYEMYINATDYFAYFGPFSGALLPNADQSQYVTPAAVAANPSLADRGIMVAFGAFDIAFDDSRKLQVGLDASGITHLNLLVPWASHWYNLWQHSLYNFGRYALWKPRPFTVETGRGMGGRGKC
jgi:enterochelin esterase-like enzyme